MPVTSLPVAVCHSTSEALVDENTQPLTQLQKLLATMPSTSYQRLFRSQSVGKHVRHILEHYHTLLTGINDSIKEIGIDYEQRPRQTALEENPDVAAKAISVIKAPLVSLADRPIDTPIIIHYPIGDEGHSLPLTSSLGRELAFLSSHTVHHMALIRLLCESMNITLSSDFGVHPSTLRYWQQQPH
ncbi:hypothetical protein [Halomonas sp. SpR8]|uniref:hypothetical protein n=1 Tax=Halomonas sp. SpR8 TaxID=3050463 RepID=UPI0027E58F02|nr:hypothetical protein [Halomonas sp. SpR8]MDQ7728823.1 hypothetical protein [Halomonas sp. SpR8]